MKRKLTATALAITILVSSLPVLAHEQSAQASLNFTSDAAETPTSEIVRNKQGDGSVVDNPADMAQKQWHPTDFRFVIDGLD